MKMLLDLLATRFDYVIIDSPPVLAVTDAVIIGTRVDSVLLIASSGDTRGNQLKQAVQRLREVNANIAGVVLNRLTASSGDYYYYYYYQKSYYRDESGGDQDDGGSGGVTTTQEKRRRSRDHEVRRGRLLPEFFARLLG
jgi:Mrp family chromosome partitioning ATPase